MSRISVSAIIFDNRMAEPLMLTTLILILGWTPLADDEKGSALTAAERKEIAENICAVAKKAVAEDDLARTDLLGSFGHQPFEEINKLGVVLIGFRLGLGKFVDRTVIQTLEPIYLTTRGEIYGVKRGKERFSTGKKSKSNSFATEILRAKPGYAVGAIRLQSGIDVEALSLTYMKIEGDRLDPKTKYDSKWVGSLGNDRPKTLGGTGHLVVGIRGLEDKKDLQQLGLVFAGKDAPTKATEAQGLRKSPTESEGRPGIKTSGSKSPATNERPEGMFKKAESADAKSGSGQGRSTERSKEPKTKGVSLTDQQPWWKWEERFRNARVGDFVQYDYPEEHLTRTREVIEIGERFIVVSERIIPINAQKVILMKFDESDSKKPSMPEPERISVPIAGKKIACKRYVYPDVDGKKGMQEVYSDDVPFDGLVGRQTEKGSVHLRRFARGSE